jgi:hypothetical protein
MALLGAIYLAGTANLVSATQGLSRFTTPRQNAHDVLVREDGGIRTTQAVLDLVSRDGDPVLAWTADPTIYSQLHRVPATRFITTDDLSTPLVHGRRVAPAVLKSPSIMLTRDLARSSPALMLTKTPVPAWVQAVAQLFPTIYPDASVPIGMRSALASQILDPSTPTAWHPDSVPSTKEWQSKDATVIFRSNGSHATDLLPVHTGPCFVLRGNISSNGAAGGIDFRFDDNDDTTPQLDLVFDGDHVSSLTGGLETRRLPSGASGSGPTAFTLVVGQRAAGLIVDGQLRAAVPIFPGSHVSANALRSQLTLTDLASGPGPAISGC